MVPRRVPQQHFTALDFEGSFLAIFEEFLWQAPRIRRRSAPSLAGLRWRDFLPSASASRVFESPSSAEPLNPHRMANFLGPPSPN
jgi:hypothetical protein